MLLLGQSGARAAVALGLLAGLGAVVDLGMTSEAAVPGAEFLLSVLTVVTQYWLTRTLLGDVGMMTSLRARFPPFFLLGVVSTVGIALGLILLVVPGVLLFVRWSMAGPVLLAQDEGVLDSLRRSWSYTAGHFWPIFFALVMIYLPCFTLAVCAIAVEQYLPSPVPAIIVANACVYGGIVLGWHAAVAIYSLLGRPDPLSEVFA